MTAMRGGFERVLQYLWLFAVALSAAAKVLEVLGLADDMSIASLVIIFAAALPLSMACFPVFDGASSLGYPLGWGGEWLTIAILGFVQWFALGPMALRALRRRSARHPSD
jgi:hypothetical protein